MTVLLCNVVLSMFFFLMIRLPPRSTRTDTLLPYTTLFRSREDFDAFLGDPLRLSGIGRLRDIPRPGHAIHDDPLGIMAHAIDVRNRNAALFEKLEDRGLARQAGKCLGINPFISTTVEGDRAAVAADLRIPARTPEWLPLQHCHASAHQPLNLPGDPPPPAPPKRKTA